MTNSKQIGVVNEIIAYVLKNQDHYMHYCRVMKFNPGKTSLYNWIFSNGQSEYSKNAITRAVNKMQDIDWVSEYDFGISEDNLSKKSYFKAYILGVLAIVSLSCVILALLFFWYL